MKKTQLTITVFIGLVLIVLSACEQAADEAPEVVRPVRILTISSLRGGETQSYPGEIEGVQNAELAFEVSGRLIELPTDEGVDVTENQMLARLDPSDYQSSLDAALADYQNAKDTFERFSEVFEKGAISRQDFDNQKRQYAVAEAQLTSARKALADTQLRAPFAGRVGKVYVDNFNNIQAKQAVLLLQDLTQLEVVVNVPEQDWLRAKRGLTLAQQTERVKPSVSLSTLPNRSCEAEIVEGAASADPVTRTFAARARFDPPDDKFILPGMSATVTVHIPTDIEGLETAVQIPANAIVGGNEGGAYVWKVDDDSMTVSLAPVTAGRLSGAEIEVITGLESGDRIAVSGVQHLADGMKIRELTN